MLPTPHAEGAAVLSEGEERYSFLADAVPLMLWTARPDGYVDYFNRAWYDYSGLTRAQSEGWAWAATMLHPDDRERCLDRWKRTLATGESYEMEYRFRRAADGTYRWFLGRGSARRNAAGAIVQWVGTCMDIDDTKSAESELRRAHSELEIRVAERTRELQRSNEALQAEVGERRSAEQALRDSESRLHAIIANEPECVKTVSPDGLLLDMNPAGLRMIEADDGAQVFGRSVIDLVHPDDRAAFIELHRSASAGGTGQARFRVVGLKGGQRWMETHSVPLRSADGRITSVLSVTRDFTERRNAEAGIKRLNRVYAVLSGINALIVRVRDRDELFREACRIAVDEAGFRMAFVAVVDRATAMIVPVASAGKDDGLMAAIRDILASSEGAAKTMVARAIREKKAVVANDSLSDPRLVFGKHYSDSGIRSLAVMPLVFADEAVGVLALYTGEANFFDEQEMKLLTELASNIAYAIGHIDKQERLDYLAYYDELTGLANRSLFLERVAQHVSSAASGGHMLAVLLLDLERFRNINASLGRPAGDALLQQVAQWLKVSAGDANLVARLGADQFAMVIPEVIPDTAMAQLLNRTMAAFLEHPFRLDDVVLRVAARVGVATFPDDGADAEKLLRNAEAALKKAKADGERFLFYAQQMTDKVAGKLVLENQLRQALDNGEFVLHYQPKVNLESGVLTGAEALIRWNDPRRGLVPPGQFIPVLEETGLIHDVGRWALRKAIEDYLRWRAAGLPAVRIAVNVSPLQLRDSGFVAEIEQAIGIDAHAAAGLELEITESLIMADVKHGTSSLRAIRVMGVTVAIDDFGTGFSSLGYLAKLPVDALKIDRSFVVDMTSGPQGLALVSTIIHLAHSLKLKVVAEGVETAEQSRLLRLLRCDEMQGFLLSKPVPAESFEARFLAPSQAPAAPG
jgi:diguanylate cyclase (GGDEF)-like protein/PAS domain S-box-containing protein